jgi:hypothetical protein
MKLNYLQFPVIRDLGAGTLKKAGRNVMHLLRT